MDTAALPRLAVATPYVARLVERSNRQHFATKRACAAFPAGRGLTARYAGLGHSRLERIVDGRTTLPTHPRSGKRWPGTPYQRSLLLNTSVSIAITMNPLDTYPMETSKSRAKRLPPSHDPTACPT